MKLFRVLFRIFSFIFITLIFLIINLYLMGLLICRGPSSDAKNLFITTFLESGQMKFIVKLFANEKEINNILNKNKMDEFDVEMDDSLINTTTVSDDVTIEEVTGNTFYGKMLIIKDPSRVKLATTYKNGWGEYGKNLETIVKENNALAGVNGGLYYSVGNKGGKPLGVVVSDNKILYNDPTNINGLYLIGFNENNVLKIIDLNNKNKEDIENIIKEEKIRDAITFQDETNGSNAHFVKLIINGEKRDLTGTGSGVHPRTCIGQKEDGTVLILVTDGRGANGHLGATASDLIRIMSQYGAVNAANIDGGSSSSMYYKDKYEMTSVTFYLSNTSWRLPTAFIVEKR